MADVTVSKPAICFLFRCLRYRHLIFLFALLKKEEKSFTANIPGDCLQGYSGMGLFVIFVVLPDFC